MKAPVLETVRLGGVTVKLQPGTGQVVTAKHRLGWHATVSFWQLTDDGWRRAFKAREGRIGANGLVRPRRRAQGSDTTPLGSFRLLSSFGTHPGRAAWALDYRRIRPGDYWVGDNTSAYYNRYRNKSAGGFRWRLGGRDDNASERLSDYPEQYEWAIVIGYNHAQVRHRGTGIFLHVNGRAATAGCVSAPRWFIRDLMGRLDPAQSPMIAIGR